MAEEVENPRRNILLATVFTCLIIGILSMIEVYVAQVVWPADHPFSADMVDTAFVHVAARVGGVFLFQLLNATLLVANLGSAIAAQFGASRLMYSMGRDNSLPSAGLRRDRRPSSRPDGTTSSSSAQSLLTGAFLLSYQQGAELLNFGAFIAFIGVNAAALIHYKFRSKEKVTLPLLIPALGIIVCTFIWLHLSHSAQILGVLWIGVGLLVAWFMRRSKSPIAQPQ